MFPNALAWGHFQLRGGWRGAFTIAGIYALATVGIHTLIHTLSARSLPFTGSIVILAILQSMTITVFAAVRIGTAIRTDVTSRVIESHRLMPTTPTEAIVGYMIGGAAGPLVLFTTGIIVGAGICLVMGLPVEMWLISNAVMLIFGVFLWCIAAMNAFGARPTQGKRQAGMGWIGGLSLFGFVGGGAGLAFVPALMLIFSPLLNSFSFTAAAGRVGTDAYAVSLAAQITIGAICFYGATRRYVSDARRGLTPFTALLLPTIWVAMSVYGIDCWEHLVPALFSGMGMNNGMDRADFASAQLVGSLIGAGLISILPLSVAIRSDVENRIRRENDATSVRKSLCTFPTLVLLVALIMTITLMTMPLGARQRRDFFLRQAGVSDHAAALLLTAVIALSFLLSCMVILRSFFLRNKPRGAGWSLFLYCVIVAGVPFGIDLVRAANDVQPHGSPFTRIANISPPIALVSLWSSGNADPFPGVMVQLGIAMLLTLMLLRRQRNSLNDQRGFEPIVTA